MTTSTEIHVVDFSTDKKLKTFILERVKECYDNELSVEDVHVKVVKMSLDQSIDPTFMGNMWTIMVSYRDDEEESVVYQTKTMPDPRTFKRDAGVEGQIALIDSAIDNLRTSTMYLNAGLYRLQYK
jgi:hypothetical protein